MGQAPQSTFSEMLDGAFKYKKISEQLYMLQQDKLYHSVQLKMARVY